MKEHIWSEDQKNGWVILEFTTTSRPGVVSWVLSFESEATLMAPADLRGDMKATTGELLKGNRFLAVSGLS